MESNKGPRNGEDIGDSEDLSIHLSDVIAVIREADPDIFNQIVVAIPPENRNEPQAPHVVILEEPATSRRFRYECEGRLAGPIIGATSTTDNKTYPTIQVMNFVGRATVVVSCVTKDFPHKPHPHNLVGREGCKKGVCTLEINSDDMKMVFEGSFKLGIQCVKKKEVETALKVREEFGVDPFKTGFGHRDDKASIDLNVVRLCFQVFLEEAKEGKFKVALDPVVSVPIYDERFVLDLVIIKLSHCNAPCNGGQEMILLTKKVVKDDITIRFYEEATGWEGFADFNPSHEVLNKVAITFRTPRYKKIDILEPVEVKVQLRRPSDGVTSEPLDFEMLPFYKDDFRRKRHRSEEETANLHAAFIKKPTQEIDQQQPVYFKPINDQHNVQNKTLNPKEATTSPAYVFHGDYRNPAQTTPSLQPQGQSQLSPPMFVHQNTHSPNFIQGGTFQQIRQQAPRQTIQPMSKILQQSVNQNYRVQTTTQAQFGNNNGSNIIWNDFGNNGNNPSTSRAIYAMPGQPSTFFNQPMSNATNAAQIFGMPQQTKSSLLMFDIENLSGEVQNLSVSDEAMKSSK